MKLIFRLLISIILFAQISANAKNPDVLAQKYIGDQACGLCALINSLIQSQDEKTLSWLTGNSASDKAREFGSRFGTMPSVVYRQRTAYTKEGGIPGLDLLAMINALRKEQKSTELSGQYLIRKQEETSQAFVSRVRRTMTESINAGFYPILSVRSVMANKTDSGSYEWHGITAHWVTIVGVEQPADNDDVLLLRIADSITGKIIIALLYSESRAAKVPLNFTVDDKDKENWNWINSDLCLFLSIPSLPLGTLKASWQDRTFISAEYLIGQKIEQDAAANP